MLAPHQPRALLLTPIVPRPTGNGLAMRAALAVEALSRISHLQVAIVPVSGPVNEQELIWLRERVPKVTCTPLPGASVAGSSWLASAAGRKLLRAVPSLPQRARQAAPACAAAVASSLGEHRFDLVYVFRTYLAGAALPFLAADNRNCRVLDIDESDAGVLRELGQLYEMRDATRAASTALGEASRYENFFRASFDWFDTLFCASELECESLGRTVAPRQVMSLPNAVHIPAEYHRPAAAATRSPNLLFLGNLDYLPNLDAAERLVLGVFPWLCQVLPGTRVNIVGAGAERLSTATVCTPGVTVHGYRDDLEMVYAEADILVAPLRAGGGTRIKLLEAAARSLPIVATSKAAEGLGLRPGVHFLAAEDDEGLANSVCRLWGDPELADSLAGAAADYVSKHHSFDSVAARLAAIVSAACDYSTAYR